MEWDSASEKNIERKDGSVKLIDHYSDIEYHNNDELIVSAL